MRRKIDKEAPNKGSKNDIIVYKAIIHQWVDKIADITVIRKIYTFIKHIIE